MHVYARVCLTLILCEIWGMFPSLWGAY